MSTNYNQYLRYLTSFADSHILAVEAETNIYPLFEDIKRLVHHYRSTIEKFQNIQKELVAFIDRIEYDEDDFDYYQSKLQVLREIDGYLQELSTKQVSQQTASEIQRFINDTYNNTSLYTDIKKIEEQVLAKINYTYEMNRKASRGNSGCMLVFTVIIGLISIIVFTIYKL